MEYTILSVCTGDYFYDAFDITVPSWFKENCKDIVVYTDKDFVYPGVDIRPQLPKTKDWIEAVGIKADALRMFLQTYEGGNLVFLDMDCYMVKDVAEIFDNKFTLAASWIEGSATANCGTWYAQVLSRVNCSFREFSHKWQELQYHYYLEGKGTKAHTIAYDQIAFTDLLSTVDYWNCPGEIWNSRRMLFQGKGIEIKNEAWRDKLKNGGAKVLHFVNDSWRDKNFVKEMAALAGE